jgi:hypothetical protein
VSTIRERAAQWGEYPTGAAGDRRALLDALDYLVEAVDVHGVCGCVPPYPRGGRHAPECDDDPDLRATIARVRLVAG